MLLATNLQNANKAALRCANKLIKAIDGLVDNSDFDKVCEEYYTAIIKAAGKGITNREMSRKPPFSKHQHNHAVIIKSLFEAGKIEFITIPKNKQGKLRKAYVATGLFYVGEQTPLDFNPIYWDNNNFRWVVQAKALKSNHISYVGSYNTEPEAVKAYNEFIDNNSGRFPTWRA